MISAVDCYILAAESKLSTSNGDIFHKHDSGVVSGVTPRFLEGGVISIANPGLAVVCNSSTDRAVVSGEVKTVLINGSHLRIVYDNDRLCAVSSRNSAYFRTIGNSNLVRSSANKRQSGDIAIADVNSGFTFAGVFVCLYQISTNVREINGSFSICSIGLNNDTRIQVAVIKSEAGRCRFSIYINVSPVARHIGTNGEFACFHTRSVVDNDTILAIAGYGNIVKLRAGIAKHMNAMTSHSVTINNKIPYAYVFSTRYINDVRLRLFNRIRALSSNFMSSAVNSNIAGSQINCALSILNSVKSHFNIIQQSDNRVLRCRIYSRNKFVYIGVICGSFTAFNGAYIIIRCSRAPIRQRSYRTQREHQAHGKQHCQNALFHTDSPFPLV